MGIFDKLVTAVAGEPPPPIAPPYAVIEDRLAAARGTMPALEQAYGVANYWHELAPGPETATALQAAKSALTDAMERLASLELALKTAKEVAVQEADAEQARQHNARLKALEAHATTWRRAIKKLGVELERAVRAWNEVLDATDTLVRVYPGRFPQGHMATWSELHHSVRIEIGRLSALADPNAWSQIGSRRHFLEVSPAQGGMFHKDGTGALPSLEDHARQASEHLLTVARGLPVPRATVAPLVEDPVRTRPDKVLASDIPNLAELRAQWAEMQEPDPDAEVPAEPATDRTDELVTLAPDDGAAGQEHPTNAE